MIAHSSRITWFVTILLVNTKMGNSEPAKKFHRVERADESIKNSQIDAKQVNQTEFELSQVTGEALEFKEAQNAFIIANELLSNQDQFEEELAAQKIILNDTDTPEFHHSQFLKTKPGAIPHSRIALTQEFASITIKNSLNAEGDELLGGLLGTVVSTFTPCPIPRVCNSRDENYRRYDGSCNNKEKTLWGKLFTPTTRLVSPPNYEDGISKPRISVSGNPLPSARLISSKVASDINKPSPTYTLSVMQWGQFIDHDITHTPIAVLTLGNGLAGIQCCNTNGQHLSSSLLHEECFPIDIPANDPFYQQFGRRCMNFVRSLSAPSIDCRLGFRNQMNQISHYLDGSNVYGSTDSENSRLRTFTNGLLKVRTNSLPPDDSTSPGFDYLCGDFRCNEQPQLSIIQTIWLRQHNKVARKLRSINLGWNDEKIFQETRRIIVAQIQHIVYNEWLPIILGTETMEYNQLVPKVSGYSTGYSKTKDPRIINEFSAVAFRFGHSLVQGDLELRSNYGKAGSVVLSENFGNSELVFGVTTFEQLLRGLFKQPMQNLDICVVDDLSKKLFKTNKPFGLDLVALNIQRGRDHGIGTYSQLRDICRMRPLISFDDADDYIDAVTMSKFKAVYNNLVEDVDAYIAGISEKPYTGGGILGTLFNCIVAKQFFQLKFGDRFYYENGGLPSSFKLGQLDEIRKTTWARIICDNSVDIKEIQPLAFKLPGNQITPKAQCVGDSRIPTINLNLWKE